MNPRVLIIDDQRDYRELLSHHLKCEWPEAHIVKHDPNADAPLSDGFDGASAFGSCLTMWASGHSHLRWWLSSSR